MKKPEKVEIKEISDSMNFRKATKLSKREVAICNIGVNEGLDWMEKYYKQHIKENYIKKEELPTKSELNGMYCRFCKYEECNEKCDMLREQFIDELDKRLHPKS